MSKNFTKVIAVICLALLTVFAFGGFAMVDTVEAGTALTGTVNVGGAQVQTIDDDEQMRFMVVAASLVAIGQVPDETEAPVVALYPLNEGLAAEAELVGYKEIPVFVDEVYTGSAIMIEGSAYVSATDYAKYIGVEMDSTWDADANKACMSAEGIEIELVPETEYIIANGRALPCGEIMNINGVIVAPVRELSECFGITVDWDVESFGVVLDLSELEFIETADEFYVEEDLYWLSHIIFAESGNQPLDGMIGVGNVVLNRVKDPTCPDSIYDVIFDNRYGVQFSVTETGSIYLDPSEEAVVAAKLCLEGHNTVGESLYFVNPVIGASNWFATTRTFVDSIGQHDFYA